MICVFIGAGSGIAQFWMLSKFTHAIAHGTIDTKSVFFAVIQFFFPLAVLLLCVLLFPGGLLWSGIGMAATLIICALVKFVRSIKG